jgi:hypothetical protein
MSARFFYPQRRSCGIRMQGRKYVPETIKKAKRERRAFGTYYFRFSHGESASDVFDRVSTWYLSGQFVAKFRNESQSQLWSAH